MNTIDRILQLVDESGLTAKEYAINAGLGAGNITDWKTGRSKPSVESLQKISKYAGVQLEWLTGDSKYKTKDDERLSIISNINNRYRQNLLNLGINNNDVEDLLSLNPLCISSDDKNTPEELAKPMIDKINYIYNAYSPKVVTHFLSVMKNIFLEEQNILKNKSYEELKKEFDKAVDAGHTLVEYIEENNLENFYKCPVYGRISAGQPNWAEECLEGYLPIDPNLMNIINPEECFFLRVNGESMNKVVRNGAYALIRKQDIVDNGEIAAVLVNGYDATLKKFTQHNDVIVLEPMSNDPSFQTQIYDKSTEIKILGKYIGKFEINN